jgi:hypothetical protein
VTHLARAATFVWADTLARCRGGVTSAGKVVLPADGVGLAQPADQFVVQVLDREDPDDVDVGVGLSVSTLRSLGDSIRRGSQKPTSIQPARGVTPAKRTRSMNATRLRYATSVTGPKPATTSCTASNSARIAGGRPANASSTVHRPHEWFMLRVTNERPQAGQVHSGPSRRTLGFRTGCPSTRSTICPTRRCRVVAVRASSSQRIGSRRSVIDSAANASAAPAVPVSAAARSTGGRTSSGARPSISTKTCVADRDTGAGYNPPGTYKR